MQANTSDDKNIITVLMAKPGIDTHWRGAIVIAQALRDAGMEVIYSGTYKSPETIIKMAVEEDVDVIAMSYMGGSHIPLSEEIIKNVKEKDAQDICLIAGGVICEHDKGIMKEMGITGGYGPGTPMDTIIGHITQRVKRERWNQSVYCRDCRMFMPEDKDSGKAECDGMIVTEDTEVVDCLNFQIA